MPAFVAASDLARIAYCPRQFYYARRDDDRTPPPAAHEVHVFAFDYPGLLDTADDELASQLVSVSSVTYRGRLTWLHERDDWDALTDPVARDELFAGRDCRGVAHRLVGAPDGGGNRPSMPVPSLVSPSKPPERGVWEPQRIRVVALAKTLAWEREAPMPRALIEHLAIDAIRTVGPVTGNKAAHRRTFRVARNFSFVSSRLRGSAKCESYTYRERYGVKTWSLSSLLGR